MLVRAVPDGRGRLQEYLDADPSEERQSPLDGAARLPTSASRRARVHLLDARCVILVTERQSYILRVRELCEGVRRSVA